MTNTLPIASVVSRALRRDCGIITQPSDRCGYSVHRGGGTLGPSIWVSISDADASNQRAARRLYEELTEVRGWTVSLATGSSILYVSRVPSKSEALAAEAEYDRKDRERVQAMVAKRLETMPTAIGSKLGFLG